MALIIGMALLGAMEFPGEPMAFLHFSSTGFEQSHGIRYLSRYTQAVGWTDR